MNICVNLKIELRIIPTIRIITGMTRVICLVCPPKCTPPVRLFWQSAATWAKGGSWPWCHGGRLVPFSVLFLFFLFKRQKPTGGKSITSTTHLFNFAIKNHKLTDVSKGPRSLMTKGRFLIAAVNSEAVKALERLWSTDLGPWQRWRFLVGDFIQTIFQPSSMNSSPHWIPGNQFPIWMHFTNAEKNPVPWHVLLLFFHVENSKGIQVLHQREASLADLPRIPAWSADRSSTVV